MLELSEDPSKPKVVAGIIRMRTEVRKRASSMAQESSTQYRVKSLSMDSKVQDESGKLWVPSKKHTGMRSVDLVIIATLISSNMVIGISLGKERKIYAG